ncbi:hypothetical protein FDP41_005810 [Naegleria fowleri]|uniref:Uncharacterized protein n=1 Tax=Naegleria fowleri TaxID=5763 RepID=A0A6A5BDB6_NAEFO|nr:uncharacterized protein FDP41_005810 [Naegleria fowleri]KAF0975057.1 hypothetical protein FDP41_005810 [Naegleria fowleri]
MKNLGFSETLFIEEITNTIKQDLKLIGKGKRVVSYEKESKRFVDILFSKDLMSDYESETLETSMNLFKECLHLIFGFLNKLIQAKQETTPKEIILHKFCLNCRFCVFVLFELMMFPNHMNDFSLEEWSNDDHLLGKIAQHIGMFDEIVTGVMISLSFLSKDSLFECLSSVYSDRYSNQRTKKGEMKLIFTERMLYWTVVASKNRSESCSPETLTPFPALSDHAFEALFKQLIHTTQYFIYMTLKHQKRIDRNSSNVMRNTLQWIIKLWNMNHSKLQPLLTDLIQRKIIGLSSIENKNSSETFNEFCTTVSYFVAELLSHLVNDHSNEFSSIAKFVIGSIEKLVTANLVGGKEKRKTMELLQTILVGDVEQSSIRNVNRMLEFILGKVLPQDKHCETRMKALEILQLVMDTNCHYSTNEDNPQVKYNRESIFQKLELSLKTDPNQTVRLKIMEIWNSLAQQKMKSDETYIPKYFEMIIMKCFDKDKRIRMKCFQIIQDFGVCKLNQILLKSSLLREEGDVRSRSTNNLFRRSLLLHSDKNGLISEMIKKVLIYGIVDEEKKVNVSTQQMFIELVTSLASPQKVLHELDLYYQQTRTTTTTQNSGNSSTTTGEAYGHVWTLFESSLKNHIGLIYERSKSI